MGEFIEKTNHHPQLETFPSGLVSGGRRLRWLDEPGGLNTSPLPSLTYTSELTGEVNMDLPGHPLAPSLSSTPPFPRPFFSLPLPFPSFSFLLSEPGCMAVDCGMWSHVVIYFALRTR